MGLFVPKNFCSKGMSFPVGLVVRSRVTWVVCLMVSLSRKKFSRLRRISPMSHFPSVVI